MPTHRSAFKPAHKPIALAVLGLILAQHAAAQQTPADNKPATTAETPAQTEASQKLDTVFVSGSRIKRDAFSSPAPITVIKNGDAALAGFTSTTQILQGTAVTGGQGQINNAYGNYVTDGGPGANTVGLRGFAPTRSLVLLNGRRLAPSGTRGSVGAADLNTLPNSIVDRIEVLKDGASSIYGSDAVAGVINIITKKDLTSIIVEGSVSPTEHGGGNAYNLSIAGGMVNDHSRFLAAYNYNQFTALTLNQRDWTRCNTTYQRTSDENGVGGWGSADFIDPLTGKAKCYPTGLTGENGVTINTIGTSSANGTGAQGAVGTRFNRWRPNPAVTGDMAGFEGVGGGNNSLYVRDTFDPRMLNDSLMSPVKNHNLYAEGAFDVAALGDAEAYWEVLFNRRESSQVGHRQLSLDYAKGSPLIPSNLAFSQVQAAPTAITNGAALGVRAFIYGGNSNSSQEVDFTRAVVGLRGSFSAIKWDYDVSVTHSDSRASYTFDGFLTDRLAQSLNVVSNGNGGFNCIDTAGGCVAAPALTTDVIAGKLPTAWMDYVFSNALTGSTKYKEDVVTASMTGKLLKLPYGDLKGAVGAEFRRASIDDTPPDAMQTGSIYNFTSGTPTRGSDQSTDLFAEVEAPLLKDLPMAKELTLNASARLADYKSYGTGSTHKIGALWAPTGWLSLRGTNGTSYRAPALFEQFVGATTGFFSSSIDPCNDYTKKSATRAANCASEGLPADFSQKNGIKSVTQGGRDAGLKAETAKNASWGIILQPTMPTGWGDLSFALDRFDIKVDNGVSRIGTGSILSLCYDDPKFRTGGKYCNLVVRDPGSSALTVNNSYINLSTDIVRGYDYNLRYTNEVGIGKLRVNLAATQYKQQASRLLPTDPQDDTNNNVASPSWSGGLDVNYTVKGWTFYYGTDWIGKTSSYAYLQEDPATSVYKFSTPNYFLHSVSVKYADSVGKWSATFGVRNLADKNPPQISAGYYSRVGNAPLYSGYDFLGRRFFMNVSKTF